ncbi:cytochrome c oxidase subunit 4 [Jonesiaceae bacterium BS-20]|uniref:Cytochrome c oxidase polypeptide 4 n=1 Tax=Jonesiaceae bacterium BS-20 TaxID=3120821 RepID=A0AAU7E1K3_9MICO
MKVETNLFLYLVPFFVVVGAVYGFMSDFEPAGTLCLLLLAGLVGMIAWYLRKVSLTIDARPEDDAHGEIAQGAGEQGVYAPWSWWPIVIASAAAISFLGLAAGWWIFGIGAAFAVIGLVGWVFEYSRGIHAH